jgi:uncharacterized protein (TIGR03435 family)
MTVTARTRYALTLQVERRTQTLDAARMSMPELAAVLADNMDRPVVDKTGLPGVYQFQVQLPLDASTVERVRALGRPLNEPTGTSESTAVERLGLRLERRRGPVEVLVVDKINRTPIEN